jgi:hypothetical protein
LQIDIAMVRRTNTTLGHRNRPRMFAEAAHVAPPQQLTPNKIFLYRCFFVRLEKFPA